MCSGPPGGGGEICQRIAVAGNRNSREGKGMDCKDMRLEGDRKRQNFHKQKIKMDQENSFQCGEFPFIWPREN